MAGLNQAEAHLLDLVRQGDERAWADLVERFQGRLFAFARQRLNDAAAAEDIVQETFIACLKGLPRFRGDASLETWLFSILRRRVIDHYRGRRVDFCRLQQAGDGDEDGVNLAALAADPVTGASWYARGKERHDHQSDALAAALTQIIESYKQSLDFQSLKILELQFYSGLGPAEVGRMLDVPAATIRTFRHRCLKQIRELIDSHVGSDHRRVEADVWRSDEQADRMLRAVWREGRLSCPKRSTLGAYVLRTLESDWTDYVRFHLDALGCHFCQASVDDLRTQTEQAESRPVVERMLRSTVGFLRQ